MTNVSKKEIRAFGIRALLSRHPAVRQLKRKNIPSCHGNKPWSSSWLIMDFFSKQGLRADAHVMEIGCGWGLAGIYCAKNHGVRVTSVDIDPDVFPFLNLHAEVNKVKISLWRKSYAQLIEKDFKDIDVVIGADICFWDNMVEPLKRVVRSALRAGMKGIVLSDPGRSPFEKMAQYFVDKWGGELLDWNTRRPRTIHGRLLLLQSSGS